MEATESVIKNRNTAAPDAVEELEKLTDEQANLACEVLKSLFNTIIHAQ